MKIAFFSTKPYDRPVFDVALKPHADKLEITYFLGGLNSNTVSIAKGFDGVCVFVNDDINRDVVLKLKEYGCKVVAARSAGFNHIDIATCKDQGIKVVRVPTYSPDSVAEHAVGMMLALNRKLHKAYNRVRDGDFRLEGLMGFLMRGKTVGVIGTGAIGACLCRIMKCGFRCEVLAYDVVRSKECEEMGVEYVNKVEEIYGRADIISLHVPLLPQPHHMINGDAISMMKRGVMLINTSRGAIIDTKAVISALKTQHIGALGIDVYEEEADVFFDEHVEGIFDDVLARLLTWPNVLVTGHQAFFTIEALNAIAETTVENLMSVFKGGECENEVK